MADHALRLKRYYTPREVAEILAVGLTTVYEMLHSGEIPSIIIGRQYRIPIEAFHIWERARGDAQARTPA